MKLIKWAFISIIIVIAAWYAIELVRYADFNAKKQIEDINGDIIVFGELKTLPDGSYKPLEVKITGETRVTGIGVLSILLKAKSDLKPGQKVKVWYNEVNIAEKVVVYSLF